MKNINFLKLIIILIMLPVHSIFAGNVSGSMGNDTTWSVSNNPTIVTGTFTIPSGKTLTIEPGVTVKFNSGASLVVAGKIIASGVYLNSITFTSNSASPAPGDWNGIEFQSTTNVGSTFTYCIVLFGGGGTNASNIYYKTGAYSIGLDHVLSKYSLNHGVNVRASAPLIFKSNFSENLGFGVLSEFGSFQLDSSIVSNNGNGIKVATNSSPSILNSEISSNTIGIAIDNSANPVIKFNDIISNTTGIQFSSLGAQQPVITSNNFNGNSSIALKNTGTQLLNAERNFWGSASGPYNANLNPTGKGDKVSNYVDFQPWINQPWPNSPGKLPVVNVSTLPAGTTIWTPDNVYVISGAQLNIGAGKTLIIKPGTIVKLTTGSYLYPNSSGSLLANGTKDSLIIFTSIKDDSYGGDSNNDGSATGPNPGDWNDINIYNNSTNSSIKNALIKFAGNSSYSINVEISAPTLKNLFISNSKNDGIQIYNSTVSADSIVVTGNNRYGIYLAYNSTFSLTNSTVSGNGSHGFYVNNSGTQRIALIDNSTISFNGSIGIYGANGSGTQTISNNIIEGNASWGIFSYNPNGTNVIQSNMIKNNVESAIGTSKANIIDNIISGNKYPITLNGSIDNTYSGNTISGNTYNNTIAIYANSSYPIKGHLTNDFPDQIPSKVYTVITDIRLNAADTLQIDPGVVLKFNKFTFEDYGKLIAVGTVDKPIIFTSYRDASYGGNTSLPTDNSLPAAADWERLYINGNSTNNGEFTKLKNVIFKYGTNGTVYLENTDLINPIENVTVKKSGSYGFYLYYSSAILNSVTADSNNSHGIRLYGDINTEATVTNSVFTNNDYGMIAENQSSFRLVSNSIIEHNRNNGLYVLGGQIPQTYYGNSFSFNNGHGLLTYSPSIAASDLQFIGNTFQGNLYEGLYSTRAKFIDNIIKNNRYPIAVWGRSGNIYTDNNGVDGNQITGNTYNKTIALYADGSHPLSDTLSSKFPIQIPSKVYTAISDLRVNNGTAFVIEPGTIIKFTDATEFDVYGKLVAKGTPQNPIVFTSYRDSFYGGKTNLNSDNNLPAPGNWRFLWFGSTSGQSILENSIIKFGGNGSYSLGFDNVTFVNPLKRVAVRKSSGNGMYFYYSKAIIDSSLIDSCNNLGVRLYSGAYESEVNVRNSKITNNGNVGLFAENLSSFREVSGNEIAFNKGSGVGVSNSTIPQSYVNNFIHHNQDHGIYSFTKNDAIDTLILIAGNKIKNNGLTGVLTSRALIIDDSISGNRYPVGIYGQASKSGTNANGNYYSGNVISNNTFNNVISMEGNISGKIGYSFPDNDQWVIAPRGDVRVLSGDSIGIKPGTILKFPVEFGSGQFRVDGKISAVGTSNNKIVFTSFNDDTYGGDTNADSVASVPAPGNWWGIYLFGGQNNSSKLKNVIVRYGGRSSSVNLDIESNNASVDSCFFSYSSNYGIYLYASNSTLAYNEIHHNLQGVVAVQGSNPILRFNNFHDNSTYGLNNSTANTISAINNYWGDVTGPYMNQGADQNLSGLGNRVFMGSTGPITYKPFLTTRSGVLVGDVTENGTITAFDASYVLQHVVELRTLTGTSLAAADVSGDGSVSAYDASLILQYAVGMISGFPSLGKVSATNAIADLKISKTSSQIELTLNLKDVQRIFGSELNLKFNPKYLKPIEIVSGSKVEGLSVLSNMTEDKVKFAVAGSKSIEQELTLVRVRFELLKPIFSASEDILTIESFKLNESEQTDLLEKSDLSGSLLEMPTDFDISQNYPNPFNPTTTIKYQLPVDSKVNLTIYNMLGQKIVTLVDGNIPAGYQFAQWNGKDGSGKSIASGVYLYRIEITGNDGKQFATVKRMMMMK